MEGRWTIWVARWDEHGATNEQAIEPDHIDRIRDAGASVRMVPVVPCDDAAVERVARGMQAREPYTPSWGNSHEDEREAWRETARQAFCDAAGETP